MNCKRKNRIVSFLWIALTFIAMERICFKATAGFRPYKIISHLSIDAKYSKNHPTKEELGLISKILSQTFSYIGHGGCVYCFASHDGKYVIKFFKHQHLEGEHILSKVPLQGALARARDAFVDRWEKEKAHKRKDFLFTSFLLADTFLQEETALIHLQLTKNGPFAGDITLYDKIGCIHKIPLSQTEFVLQKKAQMLVPYLIEKEKEGRLDEGKKVIDSLFSLIEKRCSMGLVDRDSAVAINFGVVEDKAVEIDTGSFSLASAPLKASFVEQEKRKIAQELAFALQEKKGTALARYVQDLAEK